MLYLDTNVIIRYITNDNLDQAQRAYTFLQQVEVGTVTVTTCEAVIVEAVQVLLSKSLYNLPRVEIKNHLSTILGMKGLRIPNKRTYLRALEIFVAHNIDFPDAIIVAHMERLQIATLVSFDKHFNRLAGVTRMEP